ncbi:MAG: GGDEF domain-containing protein [Sulfuricurvum sp.]|jgi:EAL domain-containing protein (putative c-di-GMP-specific phosphodiesterase class I)/GGDEF domain-containing protein
MEPLHPIYHRYLDVLDIAFQPIVDIHSGELFGVEALLRGTDTLGFESIESFFDRLFEENALYTFDLALREKVIKKFCTIDSHQKIKLFYNLDNRLFGMADFSKGNTSRILKRHGLDHKSMVFELSEHNEIVNIDHFTSLMSHYAHEGFCVAIDDFGIGQSGFKMLYHATPNIIKIDRFFLSDIDSDPKKKLLARNMVQLSTLMGCRVIAEGVETQAEFLVCKEIGCHLVQGYFVQRPTCDCSELSLQYADVNALALREKRTPGDQNIIRKRLEILETVSIQDSMEVVVDKFKLDQELSLIPVIDKQGSPVGIVHEHRLKGVIYSQFGRSLIQNNSSNFSVLETYIERIPVVDVTMPLETIVELYSLSGSAPGVLVIESSKYIGYLSARVMIEAVHERNLIRARDQNPLSRLPGNFMINEHIAYSFDSGKESIFCYFDFDHFKPYNDHYGFRSGDRVIVLFAELMHKIMLNEYFIGHIGGDDFFAGTVIKNETTFDDFCTSIRKLIHQFGEDVREFYTAEDRESGCIIAADREGVVREFKLLSVSAVIVHKSVNSSINSAEQLQKIFAIEKKNAKHSPEHLRLIID